MAYIIILVGVLAVIVALILIFIAYKNGAPSPSKGALLGGIIGIIFWLAGIFLQNYSISRIISPVCGLLGNGTQGFGMCSVFYGHVANIIFFAIIGWLITKLFQNNNKQPTSS